MGDEPNKTDVLGKFQKIYTKGGKKTTLSSFLGCDFAAHTPICILLCSEETFLEERMLLNHKPSMSILTAS